MTTTDGPAADTAGSAARRAGLLPGLRRSAASIRMRIVVGYALLLAVAICVMVVITRQVQFARLDREIELDLTQEVAELQQLATQIDPGTDQPFGSDAARLFNGFLGQNVAGDYEAFYTILVSSGTPVPGDVRFSFGAPLQWSGEDVLLDPVAGPLVTRWAATTAPTTATAHTPVGEMRTLAVPVRAAGAVAGERGKADAESDVAGVFVVAHFPDAQQAAVDRLIRLLVIAGLGVLAITTALAWSLAGRIVAPVRTLTKTARGITDSDLSGRIPVVGHDELGELGTTFNEMVDRLDRGFKAQRQFVDDIAHDLRTPLTIARGHLEVLGDDPAERDETVSIVLDELDRMGRLVSDLLVLAKAEQPDFLRLQLVDYGDLATDLLARASVLGDRAWVLDAAPRAGLVAGVADADRLVQAVLNLAVNAVQHTASGDEIGIGVGAVGPPWTELPPGVTGPPRRVRLWVRDTGTGVDSAEAAQLFQRYGRSETSRSRRDGRMQEGMGLGLSIVDAIARAHGGTTTHSRTEGGGATFTISIPLEPEHHV